MNSPKMQGRRNLGSLILSSPGSRESRHLRRLSIAAALTASILATEAEAGSLVLEHLATVCDVEVRIVDGALLYEPIQGLDRAALDDLRTELNLMLKSALTDAGFRVSDRATSSIVLEMDHAWSSPPTDQVALYVEVALEQRATSFEGLEPEFVSPIWTSVWRDGRVSLTTARSAREEIIEQATYEVEHLIGSIRQAHSYSEGTAPRRCHPRPDPGASDR